MLGGAILGAALVLTATARADDPPKIVAKTATFTWDKNVLRMSVSYRDIVDDEIEQKLSSGIPTVIVMAASVIEDGQTEVIAATAKSCRVAFDPWDDVYRVQLTQPGGEKTSIAPNLVGVLTRCFEADKIPVVERARLKDGTSYVVQGKVEVNPISKEILEKIKRWVSRPTGSSNLGAGDALFGSFVGLFVARIGSADRELRFKTQAFTP
jgi:hypothetical protein